MAIGTSSMKRIQGYRRVRITEDTVANRRPARKDAELDVPADEARYLVALRKAVFIEDAPPAEVPDIQRAEVIPDGPTCPTCGEGFIKRSPVQKYCSPECRP